jgi:hypothetical protein
VAPRFLTILTGRNLPKIGQPREAEPSIINEDDRGFYARGRGRRESWSASHGLVKVRARLLMRVKLKILLFCVRGQRLALVFRRVDARIFQRLHLEVVYTSPLHWQPPSIASFGNLDLLHDRPMTQRSAPVRLCPRTLGRYRPARKSNPEGPAGVMREVS